MPRIISALAALTILISGTAIHAAENADAPQHLNIVASFSILAGTVRDVATASLRPPMSHA